MRRIMSTIEMAADAIDESLACDAYLPPAAWADLPQLLILRDEMGITARVSETGKVLPYSEP